MAFNEIFEDAIFKALDEIEVEALQDKEYKEAGHEYQEIFKRIEQLLPEAEKDLIDKLYDAERTQSSIQSKLIYKRGLKDGCNLLKVLGVQLPVFSK